MRDEHPQETRNKVRDLWNDDKSSNTIEKLTGIPRGTVIRWAREGGWKQHGTGRQVVLNDRRRHRTSAPSIEAPKRAPIAERAAVAAERVRVVLPPVYVGGLKGLRCQFPIGDPRDRAAFRFCGAERALNRVYCAGHHALCYTATQRQIEAAE